MEHEYSLLERRLSSNKGIDTRFFAFANTVSALNYSKTNECHGWMGIRFQLEPQGPFHDIILHVRMLDQENRLQQAAIGALGVNLVFGVARSAAGVLFGFPLATFLTWIPFLADLQAFHYRG